jgi:NADH pyrophosphatase NudC (nudix superfamily)
VIQEEEVHDIRWFSVEEVRKGSYKWNPIADHLVENLDYFVSL